MLTIFKAYVPSVRRHPPQSPPREPCEDSKALRSRLETRVPSYRTKEFVAWRTISGHAASADLRSLRLVVLLINMTVFRLVTRSQDSTAKQSVSFKSVDMMRHD